MTPEEKAALQKMQDDLAAATATIETQKAEIAKLTKTDEPPAGEQIDKSELPPAVRAALEKAEQREADAIAKADAATAAATEANEIAKAERETRLDREFLTKAEAFVALPIEAAKFGPILKSVHGKLTKEEADELDRVLKAADAQIAAGSLFKEHGRGGEGDPPASALAEATQKAEEIRKADPKLSHAEALDKAFDADQALAERYLAETR